MKTTCDYCKKDFNLEDVVFEQAPSRFKDLLKKDTKACRQCIKDLCNQEDYEAG